MYLYYIKKYDSIFQHRTYCFTSIQIYKLKDLSIYIRIIKRTWNDIT